MKDFATHSGVENFKLAAPENLKILLWDVDGTLMRSTRQGAYKEYFSRTMEKVFGGAGKLDEIIASGMTDTQIMYEALHDEGFTPERIFAKKEILLEIFKNEMTAALEKGGEPYEVLNGVREILDETAKSARFVNALLTGNLSVAAEIILKSVGLWHYFENAPNAFGEISHDRRELATAAGRLFNDFYKFDFQPAQFIVIGDTPNDIACARALRARAVAVATGKSHPPQELAACEPDVLLEDLRDTKKILEILENL
ncbi:MAG TPA: HAD hydrolase-like protein [Pyrinomonadaceae bacterium]